MITGTFLTITETAEQLGIGTSRVGRFCREGRFKGAKQINRIWLIPPEDVKNFVRVPRGRQKKEKISDFIKFKQQYLTQINS